MYDKCPNCQESLSRKIRKNSAGVKFIRRYCDNCRYGYIQLLG